MMQKALENGANIQDILSVLPHRYPFLLVDQVESIERPSTESVEGSKIKAIKNVSFNEPFFNGHFPGNPIMPGVLIVEALAQAAGLLAHVPHPDGRKWNFYIMGINSAKFRKTVVPGDRLELNVEITRDRGSVFIFTGTGIVNGQKVAESEMMAKRF